MSQSLAMSISKIPKYVVLSLYLVGTFSKKKYKLVKSEKDLELSVSGSKKFGVTVMTYLRFIAQSLVLSIY